MNNRISIKRIIIILVTLCWIIISACILFPLLKVNDWNTFLFTCRYGTFSIIAMFLMLIIFQRHFLTIPNIVYIFFTLFQFGVPILYVINSNYNNFYSGLFQDNILVKGAVYSILSNLFLTLGFETALIYRSMKKAEHIIFDRSQAVRDYAFVKNAAFILFIFSGLICIPLFTYVAYQAIINGFSQSNRSILAANGLFNLGRAFFMPSCLLYICYNKSHDIKEKIIKICFFYSCIVLLIGGSRDQSIGWLFVYLYNFYSRNNFKYKTNNVRKYVTNITTIIIIILLVYIANYVAINRIGSTTQSSNLIDSLLNEMGFNFFSICFVLNYVPSVTVFQLGKTYFNTLVTLIPKSFDIFGLSNIFVSPTIWLFEMNKKIYGNLLNFGVGFSFNGEAFLNIGWLGLIISFLVPWLLSFSFEENGFKKSGWQQYVILIVLEIMITFPRRSFSEICSTLKYAILFMFIYLFILYKTSKD